MGSLLGELLGQFGGVLLGALAAIAGIFALRWKGAQDQKNKAKAVEIGRAYNAERTREKIEENVRARMKVGDAEASTQGGNDEGSDQIGPVSRYTDGTSDAHDGVLNDWYRD